MKKVFILLLSAILILVSFTGCGKSETNQQSKTQNGEDQNTANTQGEIDTKVLTFLASQDWVQDAEIELGAKFEEETGIQVDYQIIPSDQYFNVLLTKINTNEELDIFMSQSGKFDIQSQLNITENGVPLTNEGWVSSFDKLAYEQAAVDGELYGQTIADIYSVWSVAYNKKIYEELNLDIPKTFDEFMSNSQIILDAGITPIYECVSDGWHHTLWWHEVGPQYEVLEPGLVDALNNNEKHLLDFKGPKEALDQIKEMVDKGYWGEDYMSNQYANMANAVASGQYAMAIAQQNFGDDVESQGLDVKSDDIGYFAIPLLDNQILNINPAGPTRFIYSGSENIEAAKLYFDFITRTENLQYILDNSSRYSNLPFTGIKNKYTSNIQEFYNRYSEKGTVLQTAVKYINPQWTETGSDITALLFGESTPEDVLNSIDKRRSDQATAAEDPAWNE